MHLYKTSKGIFLKHKGTFFLIPGEWDEVVNQHHLYTHLQTIADNSKEIDRSTAEQCISRYLQAPIGTQEVWAAGVTYLKSRDARMDESKDSGAADCYQKVYEAKRPELFFKSLAHRVVGHLDEVYIRNDSTWDVPEPELALYINSEGVIQGYTIGNDMSSRSIEGENPLYLPQAKVYEKSAALGPCLYVPEFPISLNTSIKLSIFRAEHIMFQGATTLERMKRTLPELADYLFQECDFSVGCYLMTGTCLVPSNSFTLQIDDRIEIEIGDIGVMVNKVNKRPFKKMKSLEISSQ